MSAIPEPQHDSPAHSGSAADQAASAHAPLHARPFVYETLGTKAMHFSYGSIQSRMDILDPLALNLEYTELMMGFLLFNAQPRTMAMIGLGGGSLAKYCYAHLPQTTLQVVEINPHVIALRDEFCIPSDDHRFRVVLDDGAAFVREPPRRFDVLLVDGFDIDGLPSCLRSQCFYEDCFHTLMPGGILVINLHSSKDYAQTVERIQRASHHCYLEVPEREGSNCIVFARKGQRLQVDNPRAMDCPPGFDSSAWASLAPTLQHILNTQTSTAHRAS